ncbi:tripartite tricarboxylate transporter TctB family protein [Sinirhodobacter sp. WL0062]|uniref:Tripartite tricarboxylate transporter TctB family protein n=1 Tax=Rhodobacter flavimaris TaxID=2907145 RepID=A0ABS8Z214_9RHOB|nr:tripartite tricarboxylate transporter TctB family protein [Sinirhodobacter sp. WL0062]MCE5975002.1 tripartite tricarboxylate transporter TctB family protein [Sinirhodobacter sp. WL0062]
MAERRERTDLICGLAVGALGLLALCSSLTWDFGSMRRIGPAAFPALTGVVLIGLGLAIALFDRTVPEDAAPPAVNLRGFFLVVAGLAAFAVLIKPAGMVPAVWAAVFLSAQADPAARWRDTLLVAVVMTVIALGLFVHLLGFQARAFGAY